MPIDNFDSMNDTRAVHYVYQTWSLNIYGILPGLLTILTLLRCFGSLGS